MTPEQKAARKILIQQLCEKMNGKARVISDTEVDCQGTQEADLEENEVANLIGGHDFRDCAMED